VVDVLEPCPDVVIVNRPRRAETCLPSTFGWPSGIGLRSSVL
jgi:hypothetical protein